MDNTARNNNKKKRKRIGGNAFVGENQYASQARKYSLMKQWKSKGSLLDLTSLIRFLSRGHETFYRHSPFRRRSKHKHIWNFRSKVSTKSSWLLCHQWYGWIYRHDWLGAEQQQKVERIPSSRITVGSFEIIRGQVGVQSRRRRHPSFLWMSFIS